MDRDTVIRLAREAGIDAESDTLCRCEGWVEPLKRFAALVLANNPPQSFMAWQEGYAAGVAAEREECAKVCDDRVVAYQYATDHWAQEHIDEARHIAAAIRSRTTHKTTHAGHFPNE